MIVLHADAINQAQSLINIGAFLCIFPITQFSRVAQVNENLIKNELFASDLQCLLQLFQCLIDHEQVSDALKPEIEILSLYFETKIAQFAFINRGCMYI